ncbi:ABC transporter ATP-binding protein [Halolamina salifodinae]|uniref:NitT/TauT family transport system ATP-binding protein n=1 Tax=Halolamina salifodinae TaxID=1202767 RepID=A0A8T4GTW1_9EURY|nr:ABC transporter ATP-binding protein [Halolamina salifodinae]MBP1986477.1 NitT/TauT family transport system ATP-binding protein [Halolamina salifodinae]
MIDVEELTVRFDDVLALDGASLSVDDGEFLTVVGPSGCGKTTLLRSVGGLQTPTSGEARVGGDPPETAQSAGDLGFVFQSHTLFPWKTALENVVFLRELAGRDPERERARERLDTAGLGDAVDAYPRELSGGMCQRVAIVRAMHLGASTLLMDEPFGELDELTRYDMAASVLESWRDSDRTVLFVTHSVPEAVLLGDQVIVMADNPGRIVDRVDVSLPRPREESTMDTAGFAEQVAEIRQVLRQNRGDDEGAIYAER